jgi:hypothetical protein
LGIDPIKKQLVERAAEMYMADEKLQELSKTVGISHVFLQRILKDKSGVENIGILVMDIG